MGRNKTHESCGFFSSSRSWVLSKLAHSFPYFSHIRSIEMEGVLDLFMGRTWVQNTFFQQTHLRGMRWGVTAKSKKKRKKKKKKRKEMKKELGKREKHEVDFCGWRERQLESSNKTKCPLGYETDSENTGMSLPKLFPWSMACPIWLLSYTWSWLEFATIKSVLFNNCDQRIQPRPSPQAYKGHIFTQSWTTLGFEPSSLM